MGMVRDDKQQSSLEGVACSATPGQDHVPPIRYIRSHAALRGLAALMVVAYHLQFGAPNRLRIEVATSFFDRGYLLVDLFFVLSGFVISLTSDADRTVPFNATETRDFYVARLARVYPLHVFCLCYVTACMLAVAALRQWHHGTVGQFDPKAAQSFVEELLLVQAWIAGAPRWNIPSWSISAEAFAYAVFPLLVALDVRLPRLARGLLLLFPLGFYLWVWRGGGSLDFITGAAPFRCLAGFTLGMALFHLRWTVAGWSGRMLAACQFISAAGVILVLAIPTPDPLVIPFFALLVIATWQDRGPLPALLCNRFLLWSGEVSYSVYLNHVCLIALVTPVWYWVAIRAGLPSDLARLLLIATCFAAVLIVSQWTYTHVERSSRRYLRRRLLRRTRR